MKFKNSIYVSLVIITMLMGYSAEGLADSLEVAYREGKLPPGIIPPSLQEPKSDAISNIVVTPIEQDQNFVESRTSNAATCSNLNQVSYDYTHSNFFSMDANPQVVWPGALIQSGTIVNGNPAVIPLYASLRNPVQVGIGLATGSTSASYTTVTDPTALTVSSELNTLIHDYITAGSFNSSFDVSIKRIRSESELQVAVSAGYSGPSINASGNFNLDLSKNKTFYAVTLKQQYFKTTVTPQQGLIGEYGWYKNSVQPEDLSSYITNFSSNIETNPAGYVSEVTHGRLITIVYESSSSALDLEAALKFSYQGTGTATADATAKYKSTLSNSSAQVKSLGGDALSGITLALNPTDVDALKTFMLAGSTPTTANPGYPISYKVVKIHNNGNLTTTERVTYSECDDEEHEIYLSLRTGARHSSYQSSGVYGWGTIQIYNDVLNKWEYVKENNQRMSLQWWQYGGFKNAYTSYNLNRGEFIRAPIRAKHNQWFRIVSYSLQDCCQKGYGYANFVYNGIDKQWQALHFNEEYGKEGMADILTETPGQYRTKQRLSNGSLITTVYNIFAKE